MSGTTTPQTAEKQPKRACTECRQQKAKCDAYLDPELVCSRCRKMSRPCVISEPFKREHKRKRLSELETQAIGLQERLRTSSQPGPPPTHESGWTAIGAHRTVDPERQLTSTTPILKSGGLVAPSFRPFSRSADSLQTPESLLLEQSAAVATLPRTLEGFTVDAKDIDAMFQMYFGEFASFLPILDPLTTPNEYYTLCPFLFWAIVGVSCRTYHKNPTLLGVLPSKIQAMALLTLNSVASLQVVQGLLLVLYWPFPKTSTGSDLTFVLSGAMLHMAMQIGLHQPVSSQEFSKVRLRLGDDEIKKRAETWGHCMLVYQRSCLFKGNPATPILDIPHDIEQRRALFQHISPRVKFQLKLQDVVTRACIAMSKNGLRVMSPEQERSLDTLLSLFQGQIASVGLEQESDWDLLCVQLASLPIQAFNFYKSPTAQDPTSLYDLCLVACAVIETLDELDKTGHMPISAAGIYFLCSLMLASHTLLRLLKTSFMRYIDVERAKAALFLGISLHKSMSLQNDDTAARNAVVLMQLWNSDRAFRRPSGEEAVALRVRSRLTGSILLDGIVWWREEFGGVTGIYPLPLSESRNDASGSGLVPDSDASAANDASTPSAPRTDFSAAFNDPILAEFGWPTGDDIFSSIWSDGGVAMM